MARTKTNAYVPSEAFAAAAQQGTRTDWIASSIGFVGGLVLSGIQLRLRYSGITPGSDHFEVNGEVQEAALYSGKSWTSTRPTYRLMLRIGERIVAIPVTFASDGSAWVNSQTLRDGSLSPYESWALSDGSKMAFDILCSRLLDSTEKPSYEDAVALRTRLRDGGHISTVSGKSFYHAWRGGDRQVANLAMNIVSELGLKVETVTRKERPATSPVQHPAHLEEVGDCPL